MKTRNPLAWRKLGLMSVALATFGLLTACNNDKSVTPPSPAVMADTTCLWRGPIATSNPAANTAYPDAGANYWSGIVTIPTGARLFIKGEYPHARYISYISYRDDGTPLESLADTAIVPDAGSTNPFEPGNLRTLDKRSYQIEVVPGAAPDAASRPANTLYAPVDAGKTVTLLYRIYVPDQDTGLTGGVRLPAVELRLADGRTLTGEQACTALNASADIIPFRSVGQDVYLAARDRPGMPVGYPAPSTPRWDRVYNTTDAFMCAYYGVCAANPAENVGYFANPDVAYTLAHISRELGKVVVLRGKIPAVPPTVLGDMYAREGQLRYWSMCMNETFSQKVTACLFDQQVPINADGSYTIVVSRSEDRPENATLGCGAGHLEWSKEGDGLGHTDDGLLIMRNMLPAEGFANAIQNTTTHGDEKAVIGEYLPDITYMSKEDFEARGCSPYP